IYNPGTSVPVPPPPTTSKKMLFQTRRPVPRMIPLLHSVGVFHYVEQYIKRRRLYDEERQYLVRFFDLMLFYFYFALYML
uniref:Uncharacterized protein n=1 Tax=Xiphophorus couchianus TaxID=32473 RepID=A0A3B5LP90_9TELE